MLQAVVYVRFNLVVHSIFPNIVAVQLFKGFFCVHFLMDDDDGNATLIWMLISSLKMTRLVVVVVVGGRGEERQW